MNAPPLRVLIAEDNDDLRELLVTLISAEPDLKCVGTAADVDAVLSSTNEHKADVLVLDLELQGRSSIDLLRTVRSNGSKITIVVFSGHSHPEMIRHTLAAGQGFRTNAAGLRQLREILAPLDVEVIPVEFPYFGGPEACLHLLSLISMVDDDLAVAYLPLLPVPFWRMLRERGIRLIEVPEEEFATQAPNVLALAPRKLLMLEGNPVTRRRLEEAGCDNSDLLGHMRGLGPHYGGRAVDLLLASRSGRPPPPGSASADVGSPNRA
jgi:CheY-like chemotaxis protein